MTAPLSLAQRLALVKYLTDRLAALRKGDLLPQAGAEMPPGSRIPVMFGGRHAGFVGMPQPAKSAVITDEKKLTAWALREHPEKVGTRTVIHPNADIIEWVREHHPASLSEEPVLSEYWVTDMKAGLVKNGRYVTATGDVLTEIPGIEVSETAGVPRVSLGDDADAIIGAAWAAGEIPAAELLALPAPAEAAAA